MADFPLHSSIAPSRYSPISRPLSLLGFTSVGLVVGLVVGAELLSASARVAYPSREDSRPRLVQPNLPLANRHHSSFPQKGAWTDGEIHFSIDPQAPLLSGAWVGLVPSSFDHGNETDNDAVDLGYVYVEAGKSYSIPTPATPGRYDLRLHKKYPSGTEIESATVQIKRRPHIKCRYPIRRNRDAR